MEKQSEIIEKYHQLLTVLWLNHRLQNEYSSVSEKKSSCALCVWNGAVSTWVPLSRLNEFSKWDDFSLLCSALQAVWFSGTEDAFNHARCEFDAGHSSFIVHHFGLKTGKLSGTNQSREKANKWLTELLLEKKKEQNKKTQGSSERISHLSTRLLDHRDQGGKEERNNYFFPFRNTEVLGEYWFRNYITHVHSLVNILT